MMDGGTGMHGCTGTGSMHQGDTSMNGSSHHTNSDMPMMQQMQDGKIQVTCPNMRQVQSNMMYTVHVSYMKRSGRQTGTSRVMGHGRRVMVDALVLCKHVAKVKVYCTVNRSGNAARRSAGRTFNTHMCRT